MRRQGQLLKLTGKNKSGASYSLTVVLIFLLTIMVLLCWLYIFDTYEVKYNFKYINNNSAIITSVPINMFGREIPWKDAKSQFVILSAGKSGKIIMAKKNGIIIEWDAEEKAKEILIKVLSPLCIRENIITIPLNRTEEI